MSRYGKKTYIKIEHLSGDELTVLPKGNRKNCYRCRKSMGSGDSIKAMKFGCIYLDDLNDKTHLTWEFFCQSCALEIEKFIKNKSKMRRIID